MASPGGSARHRGGQKKNLQLEAEPQSNTLNQAVRKQKVQKATGSEWDFKLTAVVVTILAFATRFYGISHPDQVVFDEVHFGKVSYPFLLQHFNHPF